ncbi:MAG: cytochrome c [Gammaproteobacteria bacterium]|nr:cytochrome c [Gammaproteobacteria bacterium]
MHRKPAPGRRVLSYLGPALLTLLCLANGKTTEAGQDSPGLGLPVDQSILERLDQRDIFPDGKNLPPGNGTVSAGRTLFQQQCAHCHGREGLGGNAEALAGGEGQLTDSYPDKVIGLYWPYASTLFDLIRRAMPLDRPASLRDDEVYSLTAYLLYINGILESDSGTVDKQALQNIQMPNRNGFIRIYPSSE